jgi:hypothetical protein
MQGIAACINVMNATGDRRMSPRAIKRILSFAAVDLNQVLSPTTIAGLEEYRDECIEDCELSSDTSSPEYHSMVDGLAVDAPILRFNKKELVSAGFKLLSDTAAMADIRASPGAQ